MARDTEQILTEWLVLHAQSGSAPALEQLLKLWYPKLVRYATGQTMSRDTARDVVQETLLAATRRISRLRDPAAFPSWLYRILQRRIADQVRKEIQRRGMESDIDVSEIMAEPSPGSRVADAIESLGAESYQVVHLRYLIGLSVREIATIIEVPEGTVKSRLHSARAQLRNLLTE